MIRFILILTALVATINNTLFAQKSLSVQGQKEIDNYIETALNERYFPGAQLVIGDKNGIVYNKCYGYTDYSKRYQVDSLTIYDLASCTKIFSTTLSIMRLIDQKKLTLTTKISEAIPHYDTAKYAKVMVRDLLYHCSGFRPTIGVSLSLVDNAVENQSIFSRYKKPSHPYLFDTRNYICKDIKYNEKYLCDSSARGAVMVTPKIYLNSEYSLKLDSMITQAYRPERYGYYAYSDLNFNFLKDIIEATSSESLDKVASEAYKEMNLHNIGYLPLSWCDNINRIAPTEFDALFRRDTMHGIVHDEFASVLGGVGGHAGLFSNATDVAQICHMFLTGGIAPNGKRMIDSLTLERFTLPKRYPTGSIRGLGFDKMDPRTSPYSLVSFGHSGYTGTFFWIDPDLGFYMVILTNRVHPTRSNKKFGPNYRKGLWELIKANYN